MKDINKETLKAVGTLMIIVTTLDRTETSGEKKILNQVLQETFNFTRGQIIDLEDEVRGKKNLTSTVLNAVEIINKEKNKTLNLMIIALLTSIISSDAHLQDNEVGVIRILKQKLL